MLPFLSSDPTPVQLGDDAFTFYKRCGELERKRLSKKGMQSPSHVNRVKYVPLPQTRSVHRPNETKRKRARRRSAPSVVSPPRGAMGPNGIRIMTLVDLPGAHTVPTKASARPQAALIPFRSTARRKPSLPGDAARRLLRQPREQKGPERPAV